MLNKVQYWTVQNTGWSNGQSWFDAGGTRWEPARFASEDEARGYISRNRWDDPSVKWRFTCVTVERTENKRVTTEEWVLVP